MRWFYTFTASCTATIVGISLTFGINSCRDSRRVHKEARASIMQAVDNLHTRANYLDLVFSDLTKQDSLFTVVSELYTKNQVITDSLAQEFMQALCSYRPEINNNSFEKIFLGSYQLWQELEQDDLTYLISALYSLANSLETYCHYHHEQIYKEMQKCTGLGTGLRTHSAIRNKIETLLNNDEFCFYMKSRSYSTEAMLGRNELNHRLLTTLDNACIALNYVNKTDDDEEAEAVDTKQNTNE